MDAFFLKLLNMSISASWIVGVVLILRLVLKRAPKWIHCVLWAIVAIRLICPITIESALSLLPSSETVPQDIVYDKTPQIHSGVDVIDDVVNAVFMDRLTPTGLGSVNPIQVELFIFRLIWGVGIFAMMLYALISCLRLKKRVAASIQAEKGIFLCDYIDSPFILGVISPKIYLPGSMDAASAAHVLAHERAHIARRDHWWKPLGFALLTLHWFNPVLWLAYVLLCRDIEQACDEKVIRELSSDGKKAYSEALLRCSLPRHMIAACPLAFGEVGVKERVKSVLNYKKPAFWLILVAVLLCVAVAVCFLTDPAGMTLGKQWKIDAGDYISVTVTSGSDSRYMTDEAEIHAAVQFLNKAQFDPEPISHNRIVRASNYVIMLSDGEKEISFCFDIYLRDLWVNEGGEPSLPYAMEDPQQVRAFFEQTLGKEIPQVSATVPEDFFSFRAVILQITEGSLLVEPAEGSGERLSASQIWVRLPENTPELQVRDTVTVVYDGMIAETYPAQIMTVYAITVESPGLSSEALQRIAAELDSSELYFFDVQPLGSGSVMGCRYGDRFALVFLEPDGDGGYRVESIASHDDLFAYSDREMWRYHSDEKTILIMNERRAIGVRRSYPQGEVRYAYVTPSLAVFDFIPGAEYNTIQNLECSGYVPDESGYLECRADDGAGIRLLKVYSNWEYGIVEDAEDGSVGIRFRPQSEDNGWITLSYYPTGFAVCGTGLATESGTLPYTGYLYSKGCYDGSDEWSFLAFQGKYRNFAVTNEAGKWFSEYQPKIMEILSTAELTVDK